MFQFLSPPTDATLSRETENSRRHGYQQERVLPHAVVEERMSVLSRHGRRKLCAPRFSVANRASLLTERQLVVFVLDPAHTLFRARTRLEDQLSTQHTKRNPNDHPKIVLISSSSSPGRTSAWRNALQADLRSVVARRGGRIVLSNSHFRNLKVKNKGKAHVLTLVQKNRSNHMCCRLLYPNAARVV